MASPVPSEFVPLDIEPPSAPNFKDPRLLANIHDHVEKLPTERLGAATEALLKYKDGLLFRVLEIYVAQKAVQQFSLTGSNIAGSAVTLAAMEAKELLKVILAIPLLKEENSRTLLNALLLLYANDRVPTQQHSTVVTPGVLLREWLLSAQSMALRGKIDASLLRDWFDRADAIKLDSFLVMPYGRALAQCFEKSSRANVPQPQVAETEWDNWLDNWTKNEDPGKYRMQLHKILDALRHLRADSDAGLAKFRAYDPRHFAELLEDLGKDASETLEAWAKVQPGELPSIQETEAWGAKVNDLCIGTASHSVAMRSSLALLKRVVCECGKNSAQVRATKRQRL